MIFLLFIFYQPETAANQEISSRKTHKDCRVTYTNPSVCARCLAWMLIPSCVSLSGCLLGRRHAITYQMISHGLARRSSSANKLIQSKENGRRVLLSEDDGEQSETKETKTTLSRSWLSVIFDLLVNKTRLTISFPFHFFQFLVVSFGKSSPLTFRPPQ